MFKVTDYSEHKKKYQGESYKEVKLFQFDSNWQSPAVKYTVTFTNVSKEREEKKETNPLITHTQLT